MVQMVDRSSQFWFEPSRSTGNVGAELPSWKHDLDSELPPTSGLHEVFFFFCSKYTGHKSVQRHTLTSRHVATRGCRAKPPPPSRRRMLASLFRRWAAHALIKLARCSLAVAKHHTEEAPISRWCTALKIVWAPGEEAFLRKEL